MTARHLTALELDAALTALTHRGPNPQGTTTTALSDQIAAARRESMNLYRARGVTPRAAPAPPDWLRLPMLDTLCQWISGTAQTCRHAPTPHRPEPVWACAWRPALVVCRDCLPMLRAVGDTERTCDRCGHRSSGPEHPITLLTVWLGGMAYTAGACPDCWTQAGTP